MADDRRPRVTLGIATFNRDAYLGAAVRSCLEQDYASLEVLVVLDGTTNPRIEETLAPLTDDPRLRIVRHDSNRGISAAYDTFVREGRGELIAMLGDDDLCLPGRISRQVEIFDRFPDTGVVHGDAIVIDERGAVTGGWTSADLPPMALVHSFLRRHDYIVDPSRMVHRRVYERVGGYDARFAVAQDFEFWLRAARHFRFRHCPGAPLIKLRRHGDNGSDESRRDEEVAEVELALQEAIERYELSELVPELDWAVLHPDDARRQALLALAAQVAGREVPVPALAQRLRARAGTVAPTARARRNGRRLLMTMFGFNDSGGGTILPRLIAKELVRRGWEVSVFHAATAALPDAGPYAVIESEQDGVRLVGVHNRPHGLFDLGHPDREIDDPAIREAFAAELDRFAPDVVHFHNLHNLGASLIDTAAARGVPAYFTTHNYWSVCPRAYLMDGAGRMCAGPGDGARCADCVASPDPDGHRRRLAELRARLTRGTTAVLAISESVRATLLAAGYDGDQVDVVHQAMPHAARIWEQVGSRRAPGRHGDQLTVAFLGSAYPHKGPQLLVAAAQRTDARVRVRIHGEVPPAFASELRDADRRGVVELWGAYAPSEIGGLLAGADVAALPSIWWDCHNLAAEECHAAGLPLVVPRLGGLGETVVDGVDGLTFAGLDVDDLARQLDRLASEPGLLERLQSGIAPPASFADHVDALERRYAGERPGRAIAASPTTPPAVRWQGDHGLATSLSIINDRVTARLAGPVQRIAADGVTEVGAPLPCAAGVEVRHQWPPDLSPARAGALALIQPWEFGAIPQEWIDPLHSEVDELWVPSEYVRAMYLEAGLPADRVVTVPNGVDLERFSPAGDRREIDGAASGTRFLSVGGLVWRKGPDVLLHAWRTAFAGRDDVTLVIKDFGAGGVYRDGDRAAIAAHAASGALPRIVLIDDELPEAELAALYRACDVLVAPYRGEGFCMPVLEAMACGLPVITTAGGPTDEFLPDDAGWRIRASRRGLGACRVDRYPTISEPWVLEPDPAHLVELLRTADGEPDPRRRARGAAGREAARAYDWDAIADRYAARMAELADRPPRHMTPPAEPLALAEGAARRVLATPAWKGADDLGELLAAWAATTASADDACLYLLADTSVDGAPAQLESRVLAAADASSVDLDACADVTILMEPSVAGRDGRVHAAMTEYVPVHAACLGHERLARRAGCEVTTIDALRAAAPPLAGATA